MVEVICWVPMICYKLIVCGEIRLCLDCRLLYRVTCALTCAKSFLQAGSVTAEIRKEHPASLTAKDAQLYEFHFVE